MTCLEGLLTQRLVEGQTALEHALQSWLLGSAARDYLPQTWVIASGEEKFSVHASLEGKLTIRPGDSPVRDGAVVIDHDLLAESLRNNSRPPGNAFRITFYTERGQAGFEHLAKYFGL